MSSDKISGRNADRCFVFIAFRNGPRTTFIMCSHCYIVAGSADNQSHKYSCNCFATVSDDEIILTRYRAYSAFLLNIHLLRSRLRTAIIFRI